VLAGAEGGWLKSNSIPQPLDCPDLSNPPPPPPKKTPLRVWPKKDPSGVMDPKKTPLSLWAPKRPLWGYGPQKTPLGSWASKDPSGVMGPKKTPLGSWAPKRPLWGYEPQKDPSGAVGKTKWTQGFERGWGRGQKACAKKILTS